MCGRKWRGALSQGWGRRTQANVWSTKAKDDRAKVARGNRATGTADAGSVVGHGESDAGTSREPCAIERKYCGCTSRGNVCPTKATPTILLATSR